MNDETATAQVAAAPVTGDGSRPALPAMPAPQRSMTRRIPVNIRAPFLPEHHGHARHGLTPGNQEP